MAQVLDWQILQPYHHFDSQGIYLLDFTTTNYYLIRDLCGNLLNKQTKPKMMQKTPSTNQHKKPTEKPVLSCEKSFAKDFH